MNQKTIWVLVVVILLVGGWYFMSRKTVEAPNDTATTTPQQGSVALLTDGAYTLNTQKSSLTWTGSKTLIKDYFDSGTISFKEGSVVVTNNSVAAGSFIVDMKTLAGLSTGKGEGESMLTTHLKSPDFFDVEQYPITTIGIKSVENGIVIADVTIKGITQEVTFPATITQTDKTIAGTASFTIDRTLWDIRWGSSKFFSDLGDNVVSDSVKIDLNLVAESK